MRYLDFMLGKALNKLLSKVYDGNGKRVPLEDDEANDTLVRMFRQLICCKSMIHKTQTPPIDIAEEYPKLKEIIDVSKLADDVKLFEGVFAQFMKQPFSHFNIC